MSTFGTIPQPKPVQQPSPMPFHRYRPFQPTISLPDRTWPDACITKAPRWLSTDLRDGNQALMNPMSPSRKRKLFDMLVAMGYKEIEIGFPAASQTDFDFVRQLIEQDAIPEDVTISVLTQSRQELIERTAQSLVGAKRATIHLYNAISPLFRRVVFSDMSEAQCVALSKAGTQYVMSYAEKYLSDVEFGYEFSPEIFSSSSAKFAVEICNEVGKVWQPGPGREIIFNLPATVESSTPNHYADMVEYFCRNVDNRENVCVSLHTHNDRGTAVAATEFGLMAGADRVEGCVFGNGERTGNVDLITLAMNLYTQGVDPQVDISNIDDIRNVVEYCTGIKTHARAPYVGDFVYTAFSGSHQDAIKKGLEDLEVRAKAAGVPVGEFGWEAPYLPLDPHDVGRSYEAVIRVNSQSGKGGAAYIMKTDYKMDLPRRLQVEFSHVVQKFSDANSGGEITSEQLWTLFEQEYLTRDEPLHVDGVRTNTAMADSNMMKLELNYRGKQYSITGEGNGPVSAFLDVLAQIGLSVKVLDYSEHALTSGGSAKAAAYVECEIGEFDQSTVIWGVGVDEDITSASLKAIVSAVNRH